MADDTFPTSDDATNPEFDELFDRLIEAAQGGEPFDLEAWLADGRERLRPQAERLAKLASGVTAPDEGRPAPPGFTVIEEIGRGGMGVVYRARQHQPKRTVALKVTRAALASASARRRFELEAELLARLEHPGIARIYASGIDPASGQPFFAMELVEGRPLLEHADEAGLSVRERLGLVARICDAVEHAHQKGIVHRDLKPSNILVDRSGAPRVLDFGVARATDSDVSVTTLNTDVGALIGTIPYMSPEQAAGDPSDIDTRSDVYALGVVAYRLLTGRLPYDIEHKLVHEAVRVIREDDPTPLSSIDRTLRGDVQTIVAKALAKEKPRRYQSASALADDLRRHLDDLPIAARPPSAAYQIGKFARRNRALVAGVAATFLVLAAGVAVSSVGWGRAIAGQRDAEGALVDLVRTGLQRGDAEEIRERARAAGLEVRYREDGADQFFLIDFSEGRQIPQLAAYAEEIYEWLEESRAAAAAAGDEARANLLLANRRADELELVAAFQSRQLAGLDARAIGAAMRRDLLDELRAGLGSRGDDDAAIEAAVAELDRAVATVNFTDLALSTFDRSVFQRTRAAIDEQFTDQPELRARLLQTLAYTLEELGLPERAIEIQREVLGVREATRDASDPERLRATENVAQLLRVLGEPAESERIHLHVLAARRDALGADHPDTLDSMVNLAEVKRQLGKFEEAEAISLDALERRRAALGEDHQDTLNSYANHAVILGDMGELEEQLTFAVAALEARRRVFGPEHVDTLNSLNNVGKTLHELGRIDEALAMLREAYELRRRVLGDDHEHTLNTLGNLADVIQATGDLYEAERLRRERLAALERVFGPLHPNTLSATNNLAVSLRALDRAEEALPLYVRAFEGYRALLGDDHPRTLNVRGGLGTTLSDLERFDESEAHLRETIEGFRRALGPDHPYTLTYTNNLGLLLQSLGKPDEGVEYLRAALEGRERTLGPEHIDTLAAMANLGNCLRSADRVEEADELLAVAVDRARAGFGDDHWFLGVFLGFHARVLVVLERFPEAEARFTESHANLDAALGPEHRRTKQTIAFIAEMYDAWHEAEPGAGHDADAARWRAMLPEDDGEAAP